MAELSPQEIASLKSRFREIGCAVTDIGNNNFEILSREFPVATHVLATPYYLEFGTYIFAKSKGLFSGGKGKLCELLNQVNQRAHLCKFSCDSDKPANDGWSILAIYRLTTGAIQTNYESEALHNLITLWFRDVAEMIATPSVYEITGMMRTPSP